MFHKDAQIITPEALEGVKVALARDEMEHKADTKRKAIPRKAAGQKWEDPTLADWPESMLPFRFLPLICLMLFGPIFYRNQILRLEL